MGDPVPVRVAGPRTVVRYCPSTRIPLPSHAAAAACLATSGPPAIRHPPRRALSVSRTRQGPLPVPHDTSRHDLVPATPVCPAGAGSLPRLGGPPGRRYASVRALPRMWRTVPCDASTALRCCFAARHLVSTLGAAITRRALRPGNVACGDSDCGAPYHRVITLAPTIFLAKPLARLAARPLLRPVTTGSPHPATCRGRRLRPLPAAGTVVTGMRVRPPARTISVSPLLAASIRDASACAWEG